MNALINMIKNIYQGLLKLIKLVIVILAAFLIMVVFSSVISRYFLNISIAWAEEISRFIFVWIALLGAVLLHDTYGHMNLDILIVYLPKKPRLILQIASSLIIIFILCILIKGGYILTIEGIDWYSPALGFPYGIVNSIMPISFSILLLQTAARLFCLSSELTGKFNS